MRIANRWTLWVIVGVSVWASPALADWIDFVNESSTRLIGPDALTSQDPEQKAFAWGDVDQDGDIDLVVARKFPVDAGRRENVLFINQGGQLTDRTADFATDSSVPGDLGFNTPTDDLYAILVDVDLDGWLDIVTAAAWGQNAPQHIGHPRVYRNKGCTGACSGTDDWLGFRYEDTRIPTILTDTGQARFNPCFSHVDAGDVNGDGYPDLWFVNFNQGAVCQGDELNSKLLFNQGAANPGHFIDVTTTVFVGDFQVAHGYSGRVADMNGDGLNDVLLQDISEIEIGYNSGGGPFTTNSDVGPMEVYYASLGDLNNDEKLDIVTSRDDTDRYLINVGNGADGFADFIAEQFLYSHSGAGGSSNDQGFGGNSVVADLDRDGWNDVLISDVDFQVAGCDRRLNIYRNQGGTPGGIPQLVELTTGFGCEGFNGNTSTCSVAGIPASRLTGTHDVAAFDINGDSWDDLVIGRCGSTEVYINQPPGTAAGAIDTSAGAGSQLRLDKQSTHSLILDWGASCLIDDTDYGVYVGELGDFDRHELLSCSTGGSTSQMILAPAGDAYFLIAPHNGVVEGSLGTNHENVQRPQGTVNCFPRYVADCRE